MIGAVGFSSKRSLIEKFAATGPVPGSGAKAPESGAGRSQHRILGGGLFCAILNWRLSWDCQRFYV